MASANASEQLRAIAVALRAAGDRGNLNAMRRGIRAGAAPLVADVRAAARRDLPKAGGLNEYEATQRITVSTTTGARSAGVRIKGRASISTDSGTWRHPNPKGEGWSEQTYGPAAGWWSDTMQSKSHETTALIEGQLEAVAAKIRAI